MKDISGGTFDIVSRCDFEIKTLECISTSIFTGNLPKVINQKKGDMPVIKVGDISKFKSPFIHECKTFLDGSNIKNKNIVNRGDILVIYKSGSNNLVGKFFIYQGQYNCLAGKNLYVIKHNQVPGYLFHILNTKEVQNQIKFATNKKHMHGLLFRIRLNDLKKISIPIPSLEAQEKIANYLDDLLLNNIKLENDLERMI